MARMRYIGEGSWIPGVPARDLSADEVRMFDKDKLLRSGLYEEWIKPKPKPKAKAEAFDLDLDDQGDNNDKKSED